MSPSPGSAAGCATLGSTGASGSSQGRGRPAGFPPPQLRHTLTSRHPLSRVDESSGRAVPRCRPRRPGQRFGRRHQQLAGRTVCRVCAHVLAAEDDPKQAEVLRRYLEAGRRAGECGQQVAPVGAVAGERLAGQLHQDGPPAVSSWTWCASSASVTPWSSRSNLAVSDGDSTAPGRPTWSRTVAIVILGSLHLRPHGRPMNRDGGNHRLRRDSGEVAAKSGSRHRPALSAGELGRTVITVPPGCADLALSGGDQSPPRSTAQTRIRDPFTRLDKLDGDQGKRV